MTGADIRRLANTAYYMEIGEAEKLLAPLGDAARELVVMAICKLHHFAHGMRGRRVTNKFECRCAAHQEGVSVRLWSKGGKHYVKLYAKEIETELKDAFILFDELRKVAPDNGVTFGIPHLYPVRELCPKAAKRKAVRICISAENAG